MGLWNGGAEITARVEAYVVCYNCPLKKEFVLPLQLIAVLTTTSKNLETPFFLSRAPKVVFVVITCLGLFSFRFDDLSVLFFQMCRSSLVSSLFKKKLCCIWFFFNHITINFLRSCQHLRCLWLVKQTGLSTKYHL